MNSFVFTLFSFIASLYSGVLGAVEAYAVKHSAMPLEYCYHRGWQIFSLAIINLLGLLLVCLMTPLIMLIFGTAPNLAEQTQTVVRTIMSTPKVLHPYNGMSKAMFSGFYTMAFQIWIAVTKNQQSSECTNDDLVATLWYIEYINLFINIGIAFLYCCGCFSVFRTVSKTDVIQQKDVSSLPV